MLTQEQQEAVYRMAARMRAALATAPDVFEEIEMSDYQLAWLAAAAYDALADSLNTDKHCPHGHTPRSCSDCSY